MKPLCLALLALLVLLLPVLLLGPHGYVLIHDCLDTEISLLHLLAKGHLAFSYGADVVVPQVMDGIPRNALRPGLSVTMFVFGLLPDQPLAAYLVHGVLVRVAGLLAMYWLLRRYGLAGGQQRGLAAAVALVWAMLPIYSIYGLTVLGQPALLRAALDLRHGHRPGRAWLVCALFPLWSIFVYVGPFIAGVWGLGLVLDLRLNLARRGRAAWPALGRGAAGLALLVAAYLVVEWPLIHSLLLARQFVSHRQEFDLVRLLPHGLGAGLREAGRFFWLGHYHAAPFFSGVALLALAVGLSPLGGLAPARRARLARRSGLALAGLAGAALVAGFVQQLMMRLQDALPLVHAFNFNRLHFLLPLGWFGVLVLALRELPGAPAAAQSGAQPAARPAARPGARWLAVGLVALQGLAGLAPNEEYLNNWRIWLGRPRPEAPGYAAFVAPGLLARVQGFIRQRSGQGPAAYRVVCLGLPPAVAQLNGFYTLDSNQASYPLPYKYAFRPLIAGELAKSPALATYFDAWGTRCFVLTSELGRHYLWGRQADATVQHFAFGAGAFRALGGRYVLSAVRLARPAESGLRLLGTFDDPAAYWRLYVYEAPGEAPPTP